MSEENSAETAASETNALAPDGDAILCKGTVVKIGGVETVLLSDVPVAAPEFRVEEVFVERLVQEDPRNIAINAPSLRQRYNSNGRVVGRNDARGLNALDGQIAALEAKLKEKEETAESAEKAE